MRVLILSDWIWNLYFGFCLFFVLFIKGKDKRVVTKKGKKRVDNILFSDFVLFLWKGS